MNVNAGLVKCPRCSLNVDPSTHVVDGESCREAWLERLMGWSHD